MEKKEISLSKKGLAENLLRKSGDIKNFIAKLVLILERIQFLCSCLRPGWMERGLLENLELVVACMLMGDSVRPEQPS
jgi:hypothetical protein